MVGDGVAKLLNQFLPFFFLHPRYPIDDSDVRGFRLVISHRGLNHQFFYPFKVFAKLLRLLLVLLGSTRIATRLRPLAHRGSSPGRLSPRASNYL